MSEAAVCLSVCLCPSLCSCGVNTWGELMRCLGKAGGRAGGRRRGDPGLPVSLVTVSLPGWTLPSGRTRRPLDHTQSRGAVPSPHVSHTSCAWRGAEAPVPLGGQAGKTACSLFHWGQWWLQQEAQPGSTMASRGGEARAARRGGWRGRWAMQLGSPREGCLHVHRSTQGLEPGLTSCLQIAASHPRAQL